MEYQTDTLAWRKLCRAWVRLRRKSNELRVVDTLTFTFSHPVTDATLHVMNIGATDAISVGLGAELSTRAARL